MGLIDRTNDQMKRDLVEGLLSGAISEEQASDGVRFQAAMEKIQEGLMIFADYAFQSDIPQDLKEAYVAMAAIGSIKNLMGE